MNATLESIPESSLGYWLSGTATSHGHLQGLGSIWAKSWVLHALCTAFAPMTRDAKLARCVERVCTLLVCILASWVLVEGGLLSSRPASMGKSDQFFPKKIFLGVPRLRAAQSRVSAKGLSSMPCPFWSSEIVLRTTIVSICGS